MKIVCVELENGAISCFELSRFVGIEGYPLGHSKGDTSTIFLSCPNSDRICDLPVAENVIDLTHKIHKIAKED